MAKVEQPLLMEELIEQNKKLKQDNKKMMETNKKMIDENKDLTNKFNSLSAKIDAFLNNQTTIEPAVIKVEPIVNEAKVVETVEKKHSMYDEITIVHLCERAPGLTTHIQLSTTTLDLTTFGETRTLTLQQFEELVGKYRSWFDTYCFLTVGTESEYYAKRMGLKTMKDYPVTTDFMRNIRYLSLSELEDLWEKVTPGFRVNLISYFKLKIIEGDGDFKNIHKIQLLNRLSNNGMKVEMDEMMRG